MPYCDKVEFGLKLDLEGELERVKFKVVGSGDPFLTAQLGAGLPLDSVPDDEMGAKEAVAAFGEFVWQNGDDIDFDPNQDRSWESAANCKGVDPDLFFPERGQSTKEAKAVCQACDVRIVCLEAALERGEKHGIWGGTSERERRGIRQLRALALDN